MYIYICIFKFTVFVEIACIMNMHGGFDCCVISNSTVVGCLHKHFSCSTISMYFFLRIGCLLANMILQL